MTSGFTCQKQILRWSPQNLKLAFLRHFHAVFAFNRMAAAFGLLLAGFFCDFPINLEL
jgi:hypothetical protein